MKKILFILFALVAFIGCDIQPVDVQEKSVKSEEYGRFQTIYTQNQTTYPSRISILLDTQTGVKYLIVDEGYEQGLGITKLEEYAD